MTYDLGRLAGHQLVASEPGTHRYRATAKGLATAALLNKLADRVLDPAIAALLARANIAAWMRNFAQMVRYDAWKQA